eukprot:snap_masked-scaffold_15-processed-gene-6.14-mRNA-1 protein AED:1.00 eAED:1.00 QI:0/-1/0/0/-1/1/1/0/337
MLNLKYKWRSVCSRHTCQYQRRFNSTKAKNENSESWINYALPASVGTICLGAIFTRRKLHEANLNLSNVFSFGVGKLVEKEIQSKSFRNIIFRNYARIFNVNLDEVEKPLDEYPSLQAFFSRRLRQGVRPICSTSKLVSPVDATIIDLGNLDQRNMAEKNLSVFQKIKRQNFSLEDLIGPLDEKFGKDLNLKYIVMYLSPGDYHHFHSPGNFKVNEKRYFPGALYPLGGILKKLMSVICAKNERYALLGSLDNKFMAMTAVGALNVGSIMLKRELSVIYAGFREQYKYKYAEGIHFEKGEHLGGFRFGSTIILLFEAEDDFKFTVSRGDFIKMGEPL